MKIHHHSYYDFFTIILFLFTFAFHFLSLKINFYKILEDLKKKKMINIGVHVLGSLFLIYLILKLKNIYQLIISLDKNNSYNVYIDDYLLLFKTIVASALVLLIVVIYFSNKRFNVNNYLNRENKFSVFKFGFVFLFLCLLFSSLLKIDFIKLFMMKIISLTYVRRFQYFGHYSNISLPFALFYWYFFIINLGLTNNIKKKINYIIICILLIVTGYGVFCLYRDHTANDQFNHSYVMRDKNVFTFINNNIPPWTVFSSYGHSALGITSQTPNYVVGVRGTHQPPVKDSVERTNDVLYLNTMPETLDRYLAKLEKYQCKYILLENQKEFEPMRNNKFFSLILIRKKISLFQEIFKEIYRDDKYTLYEINKKISIEEVKRSTLNEINNLIREGIIDKAFELSIKLLQIERSPRNYIINEQLRNMVKKLNPEKARLSYSDSFFSFNSNVKFLKNIIFWKAFFDKQGYPSLKDRIYLEARENIDDSGTSQYIELDFKTLRKINRIKIDWFDYNSRAIDFKIEGYINGEYRNLVRIKNNINKDYLFCVKKSLKVEKIKIIVSRAGRNKLIMKSLDIF